MALKKCKECGYLVSSKAGTCPNCGILVKRKPIGLLGGIVILIVLFNILGLMKSKKSVEGTSNTHAEIAFPDFEKNIGSYYKSMGTYIQSSNYKETRKILNAFDVIDRCNYMDSVYVLDFVHDFEKGNQELIDSNSTQSVINQAFAKSVKQSERVFFAKVKKIPSSDLRGNMEGYRFLSYIDPENKQYRTKFTHYRKKLNAEILRKKTRKIRADKIANSFSSWSGAHRGLEQTVKRLMNDPDSYEHVDTVYSDKGKYLIVKTTFRGKNKFGALVLNQVTAQVDLDGSVLKIIETKP